MPTQNKYQKQDEQLQIEQNKAIYENTRVTKITLWWAIIAAIASVIGAIAESFSAWLK
jgi:hypothetical protein